MDKGWRPTLRKTVY